ncbi:MAG: hypothetical protein RL196_147 [Actinomycetota bacterium]|jgi:outer membrane protein OmpA-like peptidoglycan-associated protein
MILKISKTSKSLVGGVALATIAAGSSLFGAAAPASAALACGAGATDLLVTGKTICEVTYTANSVTNFQAPSDATTLEALLVGAGSSSDGTYGYSGAGGDVQVVSLDPSQSASIQVGLTGGTVSPGTRDSVVTQGATVNTANGGTNSDFGSGTSGNGHFGTSNGFSGGGGGAGGDASYISGGAGTSGSAVAPSSLFGDDATCYGGGGASTLQNYGADPGFVYPEVGTAECGAGYYTSTLGYFDAIDSASPDYFTTLTDALTYHGVRANSGSGGGASYFSADLNPGADGLVVLRYELTSAIDPTFLVTVDQTAGGSASASVGEVTSSQSTTLTAVPASGFVFGSWSCTGGSLSSSTANPATLSNVSANATCSAIFIAEPTLPGSHKKVLKSKVFFAGDSSKLTVAAKKALNRLVAALPSSTPNSVKLVGSIKKTGASATFDKKLASARAHAVENYLKHHGVSSTFKASTVKATKAFNSARNVQIVVTFVLLPQ